MNDTVELWRQIHESFKWHIIPGVDLNGRCPEFSWKWLVATDIKHHYFSLVNQFFRLCGRFCSSVFAL